MSLKGITGNSKDYKQTVEVEKQTKEDKEKDKERMEKIYKDSKDRHETY